MARHSGHLPNQMTLSRLPETREHTGHKISSKSFLNFLPLISSCLQTARARSHGPVPRVLEAPVLWHKGLGPSSPDSGLLLWVDGSQRATRKVDPSSSGRRRSHISQPSFTLAGLWENQTLAIIFLPGLGVGMRLSGWSLGFGGRQT